MLLPDRIMNKPKTTNQKMNAIDGVELLAGEVYCFSACEQYQSESIIGIFDSIKNGKIVVEVAEFADLRQIQFNIEIPKEYIFVRQAESWEIRDFAFNYGYHCGVASNK